MAFVCWNRFLDMSDAIEEGNTRLQENADFADTDVPFDVELPRENLPVCFLLNVPASRLISINRRKFVRMSEIGCSKCPLTKKSPKSLIPVLAHHVMRVFTMPACRVRIASTSINLVLLPDTLYYGTKYHVPNATNLPTGMTGTSIS